MGVAMYQDVAALQRRQVPPMVLVAVGSIDRPSTPEDQYSAITGKSSTI